MVRGGIFMANRMRQAYSRLGRTWGRAKPYFNTFKSRPRPLHSRRDIYPWARQWFPGGYRVQYDMYRLVKFGLSRYLLKKVISLGIGNLLSQLARQLSPGQKREFVRCLQYELPYVWTSRYLASKALYRCFYKSLRASVLRRR